MTPSGAFTSTDVPRSSGFDAVDDADGIVGLAVASDVSISKTDWLVNVTNNRAQSVTVTVSLDPSATDVGDLVVNGVNQGNTASFSVASGGMQTVELSLPGDCSLDRRSVPFEVSATDPVFEFTADRASQVVSIPAQRDSVTYQGLTNNHLKMLERDGTLTNFGVTTGGFGPPSADFDCDGKMEIPYVDGNGGITIVDVDGETQTLVASGVRNDARLGVGDYDGDGTTAVVYPNAADNDHLYRAEHNGDNVMIGAVSAASVGGVTDFNGDGDQDVVYTDDKRNLLYYDEGSEFSTGIKAACVMCIGAPTDFDGDGSERVPFSKNNGDILLADSQGNEELVWSGGGGALGSLASFDWNDDGTPDVVAVGSDNRLYWIDYADGSLNGPITDSGGTALTGDSYGMA